tara:strand:+ start:268 stop:1926 length:1659 start_codon:yes stop_codon:yes gene_type:complete
MMSDYIREHVDLGWICDETADMDFLFEYKDKIDWEALSSNQYATKYLRENQDKVNWSQLAHNEDPKAMELLKENIGKLVTCHRDDFEGLFRNETEAAFELSKEVLDYFKPGGKFAFISNSHCRECKKVPSANKCKTCIMSKWEQLTGNGYMVPLLEDFIRSEEFKSLFGNVGEYYGKKAEFMRCLCSNSELTPFLVETITQYYSSIVDKEETEERDIRRLLSAFITSESDELFDLFCSYFDTTLNKDLISFFVNKVFRGNEDAPLRDDYDEKLLDICAKKAHLFMTDLSLFPDTINSNNITTDDTNFWQQIAGVQHPKAIELIRNNIEYVNKLDNIDLEHIIWRTLSENPYAISLINTFPQHVDYAYILGNPNKEIVNFLMENFEKIDWKELGELTEIIDLENTEPRDISSIARWIFPEQNRFFEKNDYRFSERYLHKNLYEYEGFIVRKNLQQLYNRGVRHEKMEKFLFETNTIDYFRNNIKFFDPFSIYYWNDCMIRAVFYKIDYENMKKNNADFSAELAAYVFNPQRISRLSEIYNVDFIDILSSWDSD